MLVVGTSHVVWGRDARGSDGCDVGDRVEVQDISSRACRGLRGWGK